MSSDDILLEAEMAMEKSVDYMVHEFAAVRTGKASPALVENVDVQAYGSAMKLKQLALITTPEPRLLVVQPFDAGTVRDIEKALNESKIGITPSVDGKIIRLPIPELSEERRKDFGDLLIKLHEAAQQEHWREVIQAAEYVLALAPQHVEARKVRSRAWKAIEPPTVAHVPAPEASRPETSASSDLSRPRNCLTRLAAR